MKGKKLKQSQENDDQLPGSQIKYYSTRTTALEHSPPIYGKISARNPIETNGYFLVKKLDRVFRLACRSTPWLPGHLNIQPIQQQVFSHLVESNSLPPVPELLASVRNWPFSCC